MLAIHAIPSKQAARVQARAARIAGCCMALLAVAGIAHAATPDVKLGLGGYYNRLKSGDGPLPVAEFVTGEAAGKAAPTNQWYSSVMFQRWSQPLHAHPMTYRATEQGFELGLPKKRFADVDGSLELSYPHVAAIVVAPKGFTPKDARLAKFSDWLVQVSMASDAGESLTATVLHGSPFSYYEISTGDVRFRLAARDAVLADPTQAGANPRVAAVTIAGQSYAIFAPAGASWEWVQPTELVLRLPATARYFSVAGLPDTSDATLQEFLAVAYAFPTETRVEWSYDEAASKVRSTFRVHTVAKEGQNLTTLMGLYPHQWSSVVSEHPSQHGYDTVRGRIRLVPGNSFTLERTYNGFVPMWAGLQDPAAKESVASLLVGDRAKAPQLFGKMGRGTYWVGKGLGGTAQLMSVAEAEGNDKMRDELLAAQGPPGIVVRRTGLHVLRAGLLARDVRRRPPGVQQHQRDERPSLPLRLLGDGRRVRRAQGPGVGVAAEVGRDGRQDHRGHRDRRTRPRRFPVPAQLRRL